jgi:uncharacterized membrane protein YoaK (UPF0700 family)
MDRALKLIASIVLAVFFLGVILGILVFLYVIKWIIFGAVIFCILAWVIYSYLVSPRKKKQ